MINLLIASISLVTPATRPASSRRISLIWVFFITSRRPESLKPPTAFCRAKIISDPAIPVDGLYVLGWEWPPSWPTLSRGSPSRSRIQYSVSPLPLVSTEMSSLLSRPAPASVSLVYFSTESGSSSFR